MRHLAALLGRGFGPHEDDERIAAIRAFVKDRMVYLPDPKGTEAVGLASYHVNNILESGDTSGDCDDATVLAGALSMSVGRPVRLVVASFQPNRRLHHIWAEARGKRHWIEMDPFRVERTAPRPTRAHVVNL